LGPPTAGAGFPRGAAQWLGHLMKKYCGDKANVLAAYSEGEDAVDP
jgi:hypothetical protein